MLITQNQQEKHEDPRITRTRQLLLDALSALLREKSFETITVGEITERATLNRVTFYAHFQDKYALLEYAIRNMIRAQMRAQLGPNATLNDATLEKIILLVCNFLADIEGHCPPPRGQMEPLMEKQIKEEIYTLLLGWLQAAKTSGAKNRPTLEQAATVSSWAIYGAAFQWSQQAQPQPAADFVRQVLPLIKANLAVYMEKTPATSVKRSVAAGHAPTAFLYPAFHFQLRHI